MSKALSIRLAALGAVLSGFLSSAALAAPFEAGIAGTVSFNFLDPPPIDVRNFGNYTLDSQMGHLSLSAGLGPSPFIAAGGQIAPYFFGRSVAQIRYSVEVVGADGLVPVNIASLGQVTGSLIASDDPFAGFAARALWWLEDVSGAQVFSDGIQTPATTNPLNDGFNHTAGFNMIANRTYRVNILADIGARSANAFAFIDPIFTFASGFGSGYSFVFSEGVGNGAAPNPDPGPNPNPVAVPEPESLALIGAFLLPIGLMRKRWRM